jgi:hypothetical protein
VDNTQHPEAAVGLALNQTAVHQERERVQYVEVCVVDLQTASAASSVHPPANTASGVLGRCPPNAIERAVAGDPVSVEPLQFWADVEYRDGSTHREGVIRDPEWLDEPGGAEFPEARLGRQASVGYSLELDCQLAAA